MLCACFALDLLKNVCPLNVLTYYGFCFSEWILFRLQSFDHLRSTQLDMDGFRPVREKKMSNITLVLIQKP